MKEVTLHHVAGAETNVVVQAVGPLNGGGGYSHYQVTGFDTARNSAAVDDHGYRVGFSRLSIVFQNEKPAAHGLVGITMESLMAVCIDRLTDFQAGPFPCDENAIAKEHLEKAMAALQSRTAKFVAVDATLKAVNALS